MCIGIVPKFCIPTFPEISDFSLIKCEYNSSFILSSNLVYAFIIASLYLALQLSIICCTVPDEGPTCIDAQMTPEN